MPTQRTHIDPNKDCMNGSQEFVYTATPTGFAWILNQLDSCFTEPGKQTWMPLEERLVTTAEAARLKAAYAARFVDGTAP